MSSEIKDIIQKEIMIAPWSDLREHADRNAVFLLAPELDMLEVGYALAINNVDLVTGWLTNHTITRPTLPQMQSWKSESGKAFKFVIVQPHVLIQDVSH